MSVGGSDLLQKSMGSAPRLSACRARLAFDAATMIHQLLPVSSSFPAPWLLEMDFEAVFCGFKSCHSRLLPLTWFSDMKSWNLRLHMLMEILEQ